MRDPFAQAAERILARLGKDALLRGASCGKVNIENGVQVYEQQGDNEAVFDRDVATILTQYEAKQGDQLDILDENAAVVATYKLGRKIADNGYTKRYVAIAV